MLARELQTRRVIGITLGINVDALIRPLGRHNFVELQSGLDLARRALGKLKTAEETARHISGTVAPSMAADSLHPLIWDAASKLWNDGHLTAAVQRAATFLNAHVQDLTGRHDVSDSALMAQAFSPSAPEPEKPRLRWPGVMAGRVAEVVVWRDLGRRGRGGDDEDGGRKGRRGAAKPEKKPAGEKRRECPPPAG